MFMKKIFKYFFAVLCCASVMTAKAQDPVTFVEDGIKYEVTDAIGLKVKIVDNFYAQKDYELVSQVTHDEVTYKVTEVGDYAFASCWITGVTIPEGIERIGQQAFYNSSFTAVSLPSTVKSIGVNAFSNCTQLVNLTLNEGLLSIEDNAFYNCSALATITIPSTVTTLDNAFIRCSAITKIISKIQVPSAITYDTFYPTVYSTATLEVPAGTKNAYSEVDCWRRFETIVESKATQMEKIVVETNAVKRIVNGQLVIERDGRVFNASGAEVK